VKTRRDATSPTDRRFSVLYSMREERRKVEIYHVVVASFFSSLLSHLASALLPPLRLPLEAPPPPLSLLPTPLIILLVIPFPVSILSDLPSSLRQTFLGSFAHQSSLKGHFLLDGGEGGVSGEVRLEGSEEEETMFLRRRRRERWEEGKSVVG